MNRTTTHPGEILKEELEARGICTLYTIERDSEWQTARHNRFRTDG